MVKKETIAPAIKHCVNEKYGVDLYIVDKVVEGTGFQKCSRLSETRSKP